jgi:hypothetical protein
MTTVLFGLGVSGCAGLLVGDALLAVKGRLMLPELSSTSCTLSVLPIDEKAAKFYNSRTIKLEFFEDFAVAPTPRDYRLTINCSGYGAIEKTIRSTPPETHIDLGAVTLVK